MPAKTMRRENGVRHKPALIRRAPTAAWIPSPDPSLPAKRGTGNRLRIPGLIARTNPVPGPDSIHYVVPPLRGGMEIDSFMQNPSDGPSRRKKEKEKGRKRQMRRWALTVLLVSFLITALLSLASGEIIEGLPMFASILVLVLFVALGIVFDIIGLAVATADVTAFNSMAVRLQRRHRRHRRRRLRRHRRGHRRAALFRVGVRVLALADADLAHRGRNRRRQGARQAVRRPLQRKNRLLGRQAAVRLSEIAPHSASNFTLGRFRCLSKRSIPPPT